MHMDSPGRSRPRRLQTAEILFKVDSPLMIYRHNAFAQKINDA